MLTSDTDGERQPVLASEVLSAALPSELHTALCGSFCAAERTLPSTFAGMLQLSYEPMSPGMLNCYDGVWCVNERG